MSSPTVFQQKLSKLLAKPTVLIQVSRGIDCCIEIPVCDIRLVLISHDLRHSVLDLLPYLFPVITLFILFRL